MPALQLFAGNANPKLAEKIAKHLNIPISKAIVSTFSDGETMVELLENVRGNDVYIIQPTCAPQNNNLMELLALADAARRASAHNITAVVPYFGYARQDRRVRSTRVPITAKIVADMMASVGVNRIITVDLHADQIQGFFYVPVDNVYGTSIQFDDIMAKGYENIVVVSPDVGGVVRARAIAKQLNDADLAIIDKRRQKTNQSEVMNIIGDIKDRNCIIVDDIVDTAGTLCQAAKALKERGAKTVAAYCVHPVLSGEALSRIENSVLAEVVVSDTIPLSEAAKKCKKIRQQSLGKVLAEAIYRVNSHNSLSEMFPG
ncbi:MAG: ribose-phosphate pyrophosphokinase [Gammaproteobacteria bacterium]|nr:ribose-phosphate pyrophosphokinase [Gammaproteobacteria bacterium]